MQTDQSIRITSTSPDQTERIAAKLGARLRGGEVIELLSDLGGGKTTFTRGLVRGTTSTDKVASPTFTINREYRAPHFTISHFDFYRLAEAGIVANELAEVLQDPTYVTVIEWGEIVYGVLPENRITIDISQTVEGNRLLLISYPASSAYLMKDLTI